MEYVLFGLSRVEWFAFFAVIFGTIAAVLYVITIWQGHQPPYTTLIVWFVLGLSLLYFQGKTEATWSIALLVIYAFIPIIYLVELIYLRVKWTMQRRDILCLVLAGLSWGMWFLTKDLTDSVNLDILIPLIALVCTDAFGSWPILQDAWNGKEFEGRLAWLCTLIAVSFELGTVNNYQSAEVILPSYFIVMMGGTALCAMFCRMAPYVPAPWATRKPRWVATSVHRPSKSS